MTSRTAASRVDSSDFGRRARNPMADGAESKPSAEAKPNLSLEVIVRDQNGVVTTDPPPRPRPALGWPYL